MLKGDYEEYRSLRDKLEEHPGFLYKQSRLGHNNSLHIYIGNFTELQKLLNFIEDYKTYFSFSENGSKDSILFAELHRHLHNYLAGAESLVSHTRNYIRHRHRCDRVGDAYQYKIKEIFSDHIPTILIKDFRNYFLHVGLPRNSIRTTLNVDTREPPSIQILIKVESLLEWKKWSGASKKYLRAQGKDLQLSKLVTEYHSNALTFYKWFDELLEQEYKQKVVEMSELWDRVLLLEEALDSKTL